MLLVIKRVRHTWTMLDLDTKLDQAMFTLNTCIDKYKISRAKFSTFFCSALHRDFIKLYKNFLKECDKQKDYVVEQQELICNDSPKSTEPKKELEYLTIRQLANILDERELFVIICYYGLGGCDEHTLTEIGEHLNLTRQRIQQLKQRSLLKIKIMLEEIK